jgi:hypothetical protein
MQLRISAPGGVHVSSVPQGLPDRSQALQGKACEVTANPRGHSGFLNWRVDGLWLGKKVLIAQIVHDARPFPLGFGI